MHNSPNKGNKGIYFSMRGNGTYCICMCKSIAFQQVRPVRSYHIGKNAIAYTFEPKTWDYSIPVRKGFWNAFGNAILMYLILILVGGIYDGIIYSMTFKGLAPINEVKEALINIRFSIAHRCQKYA